MANYIPTRADQLQPGDVVREDVAGNRCQRDDVRCYIYVENRSTISRCRKMAQASGGGK